ncbi:MAG TPA: class I SAM-dependent methyltransferase [Blastocatellia bacterium]|nr:class I SAM-dependent methyltransferase [Blastocatellia bacterium]
MSDRPALSPSSGPVLAEDFDLYATQYDEALNQGLSVSGEGKEYFAERRVMWLADHLDRLRVKPDKVMDFGCGTGSSVPFLLDRIHPASIVGIDSSPASLARARELHQAPEVSFFTPSSFLVRDEVDLAFCNGVFHHIPPAHRREVLDYIRDSMRPGGLFALWENNPWNPGTRYVMKRIPFDKDAVMLWPAETRLLVRSAGFTVLSTNFLFIFPRPLSLFRPVEPLARRLPLGAQYQVLCKKA